MRVATVVNFPTGDFPADDVIELARHCVADGADEVDVVLPYRAWLAGDITHATAVLDGVDAVAPTVKVIIESGELPDRAAVDRATHFAIDHGADFVKTSTGKTPTSATPEAAEIILEAIAMSGEAVGFKASGGVRTLDDARHYLRIAEATMGAGVGVAGDLPLRRQRSARRAGTGGRAWLTPPGPSTGACSTACCSTSTGC